MTDTLTRLGWGPWFADAFTPLKDRQPELVPARVTVEHRGRLGVRTVRENLLAWPPEGARHDSLNPEDVLSRPRVGDWVAVPEGTPEPRIAYVLPRRTALLRQLPRKRVGVQVVAANLDRVFVVTALGPDLSPRRLERFVAAVRRRDHFEPPHGWRPEAHIAHAFGIISGRAEHVAIAFSERVISYIRERTWHPTQTFGTLPDGRLELRMTVATTIELQAWVQGFGADAEVREPAAFRERVAQSLSDAASMYAP